MVIKNSSPADIDFIFKLYDAGTAYQKTVAKRHWQGFERSLVETEVEEKRQWKIVVNEQIACVFAITFTDPFIWEEKSNDPAIYIHRIATNPSFRGNNYVRHIVDWAKTYAKENKKDFIRMDTGSGNDKLNNYYISCGFNYLGVVEHKDTGDLPAHYKVGGSSLFEIKVK
jgi:ribosomal protein S18 acetylase RimI-like enzyme